jgi:hypothetical protein
MLIHSTFQVLFLGTLYTLSRKYQNLQLSSGLDDVSRHFYHPLYQVLWLFLGMALCLPFKKLIKDNDAKDENKKNMTPSLMIIPAFFDVCATIFDATGLIYVSTFPKTINILYII